MSISRRLDKTIKLYVGLLIGLLFVAPSQAQIVIYGPPLALDASNATLPNARINLGFGASFANLLTGYIPAVNTGNLTSIDLPTGVAADSTNSVFINNPGTCTVNLATSGAGGLDTGAVAASTWYALRMISGASGVSCIATLATPATNGSPTLPAGYTYSRYVGRVKTDGSSHVDSALILPAGKYWIDATDTYSPSGTMAGLLVQGCGPGGPGASGAVQISGTAASGGGGGGGAKCTPLSGILFAPSDIGTSLTVTVPTKATGALAVTASIATDGNTASEASSLTLVNSSSATILTLYAGGAGQKGVASATASSGGGSAGIQGAASGASAGTGQGLAGVSGSSGTASTTLGISGSGAGSASTGAAGSVGGNSFGGGAGGGASGGGVEGACSATNHTGGNGGWALADYSQPSGGSSGAPTGTSSLTGKAPRFLPAPGPGGGWGGPKATANAGTGGSGGLGAGGSGGGATCAASGSQTSGAGGDGGPAAVMLTEL